MSLFHAGKLHSGRSGKIVKNPAQARAIQISYARDEGHDIPEKKPERKSLSWRAKHG